MSRRWVVVCALAAACAEPSRAELRRQADAGAHDSGAPSATADGTPAPSAMLEALRAAGLDPAQLPSLDALDDRGLSAVMSTFNRSLGAQCLDCHERDYAAATRRTRIARQMWDRFVGGLRLPGGAPLYCDSCHAGQVTFLDRGDTRKDGALWRWMRRNYVDGLERADGAPLGCESCHGVPFVPKFLDEWAAAPDLAPPEVADLGPADGGGAASADLGRAGCGALLACIDGCASNTSCEGHCKAHAPTAAKQLLAAAASCANQRCIASGRCASSADDSADCNACYSNASAGGVTGVACVPPSDPDCGACATEWNACESN
jgi:hypothetical protein